MPRAAVSRVRASRRRSRPVGVGSAAEGSAGRHLPGRVVFSQAGAGGGEEGVGQHAGGHVPTPGQGVHLRTWYWSRPSRSLPWALFSSIFQRIPATAISSGVGVGAGGWARKNRSVRQWVGSASDPPSPRGQRRRHGDEPSPVPAAALAGGGELVMLSPMKPAPTDLLPALGSPARPPGVRPREHGGNRAIVWPVIVVWTSASAGPSERCPGTCRWPALSAAQVTPSGLVALGAWRRWVRAVWRRPVPAVRTATTGASTVRRILVAGSGLGRLLEPTSVIARSSRTFAGPCTAFGSRHGASAADSARSSPTARTVSVSNSPPGPATPHSTRPCRGPGTGRTHDACSPGRCS